MSSWSFHICCNSRSSDLVLQHKVSRNSALKDGFMPVYMNGLIVLEKNSKNVQSSWTLRGTTASDVKRCMTAIIQNGIQHSPNAKTTMASDLVMLISLAVIRLFWSSVWLVEAMFWLCCFIVLNTL